MSVDSATTRMYRAEGLMAARRFRAAAGAFREAGEQFAQVQEGVSAVYCASQAACCAVAESYQVQVGLGGRADLLRSQERRLHDWCGASALAIKRYHRSALLADAYSRMERFFRQEGYHAEAGRAHLRAAMHRGCSHFAVCFRARRIGLSTRLSRLFRGIGSFILLITSGYGELPCLWGLWAAGVWLGFGYLYVQIAEDSCIAISCGQAALLSAASLALTECCGCPQGLVEQSAIAIVAEGVLGYFLLAVLVALLFRRLAPE